MTHKPNEPNRIITWKKHENQVETNLRNLILSNKIQKETRIEDARKPIFLTRYE